MMFHLTPFLIGLSCLLAAGQAAAQTETGWYVGAGAGALFPKTQTVEGLDLRQALSPPLTDRVTYRTGWTAYVNAGTAISGGWRAELEISARRADVSSAFGDPRIHIAVLCVATAPDCANLGPTGGHASSLSFLVNGLRDVPIGLSFVPHLGVGLGVANVHMTTVGQARGAALGAPVLNGRSTVFAYQLIAGISQPIGERLSLDVDYRYFDTAGQTFAPTQFGRAQPRAGFGTHGVSAGLRLKF